MIWGALLEADVVHQNINLGGIMLRRRGGEFQLVLWFWRKRTQRSLEKKRGVLKLPL